VQNLIEGVHRFRETEFGRHKELFQRLARDGQNPHTLFITCSDSRVLAELITQSQPGDLFVVKNVGNIVPPANTTGSTNSTAAAIEFAIESLGVSDVVVCGHSQCGAVRALMDGLPPGASHTLPHLEGWLSVASSVRDTVMKNYAHLKLPEDRLRAAEEENVLFALENLHTYPCVARRLEEGRLHLHGWFFKIDNAELFAYDPKLGQFDPLTRAVPMAQPSSIRG
jgi:carbonic anhydrase